jgi:hypothetical protein
MPRPLVCIEYWAVSAGGRYDRRLGQRLAVHDRAVVYSEVRGDGPRCLSRKLGREDLSLLDHRRLHEEVGRSRHQRRGDPARKVGLPTRVVREGVEDAER